MRLGSWNIVMFVTYEQLKQLFHKYQESPASDKVAGIRMGGNQKFA